MTIVRKMTDAELGWVAGFFDGEGCIYMAPAPSWGLVLQVSNCDPRLIWRLVELAGGHFYPPAKTPLRKSTHSPLFQWHLRGRAAVALLRLMLPLLIGKSEQASLAIGFEATMHQTGSGRALSPEKRAERERIRIGLKVLKGRKRAS